MTCNTKIVANCSTFDGAIERNDLKLVKELYFNLKNSITLLVNGKTGIHPIHTVVINGFDNTEMLRYLVEQNLLVNIDVEDKLGNTGLHLAVKFNFQEKVKLLLYYGSSTDHRNTYGHTPLYLAYKYNYAHISKILITHYANINLKYRFEIEDITETLLENACRYRNLEFIFLYLNYNALFDYNSDVIKSFLCATLTSNKFIATLAFYMARSHPNELNEIIKIKEFKHLEVMFKELIEMNNHQIYSVTSNYEPNSTSLLSFLICDITTAAHLMSDYDIEINENSYPIYMARIKLQIEKVKHRLLYFNLAVKTLKFLAPDSITNDCSFPYRLIANILTTIEIQDFIKQLKIFNVDGCDGIE